MWQFLQSDFMLVAVVYVVMKIYCNRIIKYSLYSQTFKQTHNVACTDRILILQYYTIVKTRTVNHRCFAKLYKISGENLITITITTWLQLHVQ